MHWLMESEMPSPKQALNPPAKAAFLPDGIPVRLTPPENLRKLLFLVYLGRSVLKRKELAAKIFVNKKTPASHLR